MPEDPIGENSRALLGGVISELKNSPYTLLLIFGLAAVTAVLWMAQSKTASAADLNYLRQEVVTIELSIKETELSTQLREIETELFQLNRSVAAATAKGVEPDPLYYDRIRDLESDREALQRQLQTLQRREAHNP